MPGWDVALALEFLAIIFGFILWFKAAKAEAGPKKLAKVVAIIIVILAVLLAVCTVTRAVIHGYEYKTAMKAGGYGKCGMPGGGPGGMMCPKCGGPMGPGMGGPGMMMRGPGTAAKGVCPMMAGTAAKTPTPETK